MKKTDINKIVREEVDRMVKESKDNAPKIEKELEKLRVKFFPDMLEKASGSNSGPVLEKRVLVQTVSDLLEIPVNELLLFFLNGAKLKNGRSLVEHHMGQIYFYPN